MGKKQKKAKQHNDVRRCMICDKPILMQCRKGDVVCCGQCEKVASAH